MYIDKGHSQFLLKGLSLLRQNEELCDVELRVGDSNVFAHKVVLAAVSDYFKAMFTGRMEESLTRTVDLKDMDEKSIALLVEFAYSGRISLSINNVQTLLVTANMLNVSKVINACCDFLINQLHLSNCLGFYEFAETHALTILKTACLEYILDNFSKLMSYDEYLNLHENTIQQIISHDNLNVDTEEDVFLFLEQWTSHLLNDRTKKFYKLFPELRLMQCSTRFLKYLKMHAFIACPEGYPLQLKINQILNITNNSFRLLDDDFIKKLHNRRTGNNIMVIGGKGGLFNTLDTCSIYNSKKNNWTTCKSLPLARIDSSAASLNGRVYVTGGRIPLLKPNALTICASVICYATETDTWSPIPDMQIKRSSHCTVAHGGMLYAIGGYDGQSCLKSGECYNPKSNVWTHIPDMNYSRSSFSAVTIDDYIYVLGGQGTAHLCTVERYDTKSAKWDMMPAMSTKRINFGAAQLHGFIFVVGGHDGQDYLRSVERYDPMLSEWTVVAPLLSPRTGIGVTVLQDQIYVLGGHDGKKYLDSVYRYDPCKDVWTRGCDMTNARCYMAATDLWARRTDS